MNIHPRGRKFLITGHKFNRLLLIATLVGLLTLVFAVSGVGVVRATNDDDAKIIIIKDVSPGTDPQDFDFSTGSGLPDFTLDDDGNGNNHTRVFSNLDADTYTVTEDAVNGWTLTNLVCNDPTGNTTVSIPDRTATIDVAPDETVTCTFTNTKNPLGTIRIIKDAVPNDSQNFSFTSTGGLSPSSFELDDDNNGSLPNSRDFSVPAGNYTVTEPGENGWVLLSLVCTDPSNDTTTNGKTANIALSGGETVECKYTNVKEAKITIKKKTTPDSTEQTDFPFTTTGGLDPENFALDTASGDKPSSEEFDDLLPGTYTVTEGAVNGWGLVDIECEGDTDNTTINGSTVSITLEAGDEVECVFTNTDKGTIKIVKDTVPDDAQDFEFDPSQNLSASNFFLDDDANGTLSNMKTFSGLGAGSYSVKELAEDGWKLIDLVCVDATGDSTVDKELGIANIDVAAGETVTCTFTNAKLGALHVFKFNDLNRNGEYDPDEGEVGLNDWEITLYESDGQTIANVPNNPQMTHTHDGEPGWVWFEEVPVGDYVVCENLASQTGWQNSTPLCQNVEVTPGGAVSSPGPTMATFSFDGFEFKVTFTGTTDGGKTWNYFFEETGNRDLSHWNLIGLGTCLALIEDTNPNASIGKDGSTSTVGVKWDVNDAFSSGSFSITLDDVYPAGTIVALAKAGPGHQTRDIIGPNCDEPGEDTPIRFGNYQLGSIRITKDIIGDATETFTICVSGGPDNLPEDCKTFDGDGAQQTWDNLPIGTGYIVHEQDAGPNWDEPADQNVVVTAGEITDVTVTNTYNPPKGTLNVHKYGDYNNSGTDDNNENEPGLDGWTITLYDAQGQQVGQAQVTDQDGNVSFPDLPPGSYKVCETLLQNWKNTDPGTVNAGKACENVTVEPGGQAYVDFGNRKAVRPILECVVRNGENDYTAFFGYLNENPSPTTIAIGNNNKFTPAPQDQGQPTTFQPGRTPFWPNADFSVNFNGGNLVWSLDGRTATASSNSAPCAYHIYFEKLWLDPEGNEVPPPAELPDDYYIKATSSIGMAECAYNNGTLECVYNNNMPPALDNNGLWVPAGETYDVEEFNLPPGWMPVMGVGDDLAVDTQACGEAAGFDLEKECKHVVKNQLKVGSLKVTKKLEPNGLVLDPEPEFKICIQGPSYPNGDENGACQTFVGHNSMHIWMDLLPGKYTVTETEYSQDWLPKQASKNVNVKAGETKNVNIVNVYQWPPEREPADYCVSLAKVAETLGLGSGDSLDGLWLDGLIKVNAIDGDAVLTIKGQNPFAWQSNGTLQNHTGTEYGIQDITRKHKYQFMFASDILVTGFSLRVYDWGDYNPAKATKWGIELSASGFNVGPSDTLMFMTGTNTTLGNHGDSNKALPGQPGNRGYAIYGDELTIVYLNFMQNGNATYNASKVGQVSDAMSADPHVGFDELCIDYIKTGTLTVTKKIIGDQPYPDQDFEICIMGITPNASYPTGNEIGACKTITGAGQLVWENIKPGTYVVKEKTGNLGAGWYNVTNNVQVKVTENGGKATIVNEYRFPACEATAFNKWHTYTPGLQKDGDPLPGDRDDPTQAEGFAQNNDTINFVSLGFGGTLIMDFPMGVVVDGPGNDVRIVETSFGDKLRNWSQYPEVVDVYASQDGVNWYWIGETTDKDQSYDLANAKDEFDNPHPLAWARYFRLVDKTDPNNFSDKNADGFDVDAVEGLNCGEVGRLEVTKLVTWNNYSDNDASFEICIKGPSYPNGDEQGACQTLTLNNGETSGVLFWESLIPGDYEVTETDPGAGWEKTEPGSEVEVKSGEIAKANVVNDYRVCVPDPKAHLSGVIYLDWPNHKAIGTVTNNSDLCTYEVGMASYKKPAPYTGLVDQELFDHDPSSPPYDFPGNNVGILAGPGQTVLEVEFPDCAAQIDLFFHGKHLGYDINVVPLILPYFQTNDFGPNGKIYGMRLLSAVDVNGKNFCTEPEPEPETGTLVVQKVIVGGNDTPDAFSFDLTLNGQTVSHGFEMDGSNEFILDAGTIFSVVEGDPGDYEVAYQNCSGEIIANQTVTCTITNRLPDNEPEPETGKLIVQKVIVGGNDTPDAFSFDLTLNGQTNNHNFEGDGSNEFILNAGTTFSVTETNPGEYVVSAENCSGEIIANQTVTCTITNRLPEPPPPQQGKLIVQKVIVGGNDTPDAFSFDLTLNGQTNNHNFEGDGSNEFILDADTTFSVTESNPGNYVVAYENCSGSIAADQTVTCTITNRLPEPQVCDSSTRDPKAHLVGTIEIQGSKAIGKITNMSSLCDYEVGMASYKKPSETLADQQLFSWDPGVDPNTFTGGSGQPPYPGQSKVIGPNGYLELMVDLPDCATQVDLFFDANHLSVYGKTNLDQVPLILPAFDTGLYGPNGNRYSTRLLAFLHLGGKNYCVDPVPQEEPPVTQPQVTDSDNDGVPDDADKCAGFADSADMDGDGTPDGCDPVDDRDDDSDGVNNTNDKCAGFADSADMDGDGTPDGCDPVDDRDDDNDGVNNTNDKCAGFADSADMDGDGTPDGCDPVDDRDDDSDGVNNTNDQCPGDPDKGAGFDANGCAITPQYTLTINNQVDCNFTGTLGPVSINASEFTTTTYSVPQGLHNFSITGDCGSFSGQYDVTGDLTINLADLVPPPAPVQVTITIDNQTSCEVTVSIQGTGVSVTLPAGTSDSLSVAAGTYDVSINAGACGTGSLTGVPLVADGSVTITEVLLTP